MELPFVLWMNLGHTTQMVIFIFIGIGFGFVLERSGFGRSDNLTSVFYGRDFRVLRVMFAAILTTMIGLYFFDLVGIMPISNIGLSTTYVLPAIVGGLVFGAGFVIGGYCPGTSIVASFSGKIEAIVFVLGIFLGSLVFIVSYDSIRAFHYSTKMGRVLLHDYFGLPSGVMVFLVILFAVGALYGVKKIEEKVNASIKDEGSQS